MKKSLTKTILLTITLAGLAISCGTSDKKNGDSNKIPTQKSSRVQDELVNARACKFPARSQFAINLAGENAAGDFCYEYSGSLAVDQEACIGGGGTVYETRCPAESLVASCTVESGIRIAFYSGWPANACGILNSDDDTSGSNGQFIYSEPRMDSASVKEAAVDVRL